VQDCAFFKTSALTFTFSGGTYVMQTLDVQVHTPPGESGARGTKGPQGAMLALLNGEKGAETARNGTSFLAIIQKMLAGSMEGLDGQTLSRAIRDAGRGAGNHLVPGEMDTLIKPGSAGLKAAGSKTKKGIEDADALSASLLGGTTLRDPLKAALKEEGGADVIRQALQKAGERLPEAGIETAAQPGQTVPAERVAERASGEQLTLVASPLQKAEQKTDGPEAERESRGKVDKTARRDRSAAINVRDERIQADAVRERIESPAADTTVRDNGDGTADMSITFRSDGNNPRQGTTTASLYTNPAADGQSFSAFLAKEVNEGARDFVRAGQIVLRENNTGTIRLTLHPETLGNVRISLELGSDRKISGRIVVDSKEAYDAFSENLSGLSDAFREGGFDTAGFNLSWSGKDQAEFAAEQQEAAVRAPFYAQSIPDVMSGTETADRVMSAYGTDGTRGVNLFA
jgi:flagellar hook-length control protein FliK